MLYSTASTTPAGNILEAPELGTPRYKGQMLVPNGVRYGGAPLYSPI